MRLARSLTVALAACTIATSVGARQRAFEPGAIWPDNKGVHINAHGAGILLDHGTYYWFGEHKLHGKIGNTAQVGVHVYASRDLYNWKDRGIALAVSEDPASPVTRGSIIERPKVLHNPKTGKYVMWFHLEYKGEGYKAARAGVAVADRPAGPYRFIDSFRPEAGVWPVNAKPEDRQSGETNFLARDLAGGQMSRDMTLFQDDDGKAYQITSSEENHTLHISQLSDDYLRPAGRYARAFPDGDNEAATLFKHDGRYYLISSGLTGWRPNAARSAVADTIFGPWRSLGNPVRGTPEQIATTFGGQSTFAIPAPCDARQTILMFDIWRPSDPIDGRYAWLPVEWEGEKPVVRWRDHWSLADICK
jgi:beta-xylosidase